MHSEKEVLESRVKLNEDAGHFFRYMAEFVKFTAEDVRAVRESALIVEKHLPAIISEFYINLLMHPQTRKFFLKNDGTVDAAYLQLRMYQENESSLTTVFEMVFARLRSRHLIQTRSLLAVNPLLLSPVTSWLIYLQLAEIPCQEPHIPQPFTDQFFCNIRHSTELFLGDILKNPLDVSLYPAPDLFFQDTNLTRIFPLYTHSRLQTQDFYCYL